MHRRFCQIVIAAAGAPALVAGLAVCLAAASLTGCASLPRHNNTLVFFTTTSVALSVGADPTSTPKILLGYQRNEGVAMPLVADTGRLPGPNDTSSGVPCNVAPTPSADPSPCVLFGKRTRGTIELASDIPSVLATFKGNGAAQGVSSDPAKPQVQASGGIVQYFATGIAAQLLAEHGGAATVSNGPAAVAAVMASSERLALRAALDDAGVKGDAITIAANANRLVDKIGATFDAKVRTVGLEAAKTALLAAAAASGISRNTLGGEMADAADAAAASAVLRTGSLRHHGIAMLEKMELTFR